jgi:hypothetical protein
MLAPACITPSSKLLFNFLELQYIYASVVKTSALFHFAKWSKLKVLQNQNDDPHLCAKYRLKLINIYIILCM